MKKRTIVLWIIVSAIAIAFTVVLLLCFVNRERAVPLLPEGSISFGESEEEIYSVLGDPNRQFQDNTSVHRFIYYDLLVAGSTASVEFCINLETDEMWQVTITWKAEHEEQLDAIRSSIVSELQNELGSFSMVEENHMSNEIRKSFCFFGYDVTLMEEAETLKLRIR